MLNDSKKENKIKDSNLIVKPNCEIELAKLVRNTFLATKVSFFNEINALCSQKNINYFSLRDLIIQDKRIGDSHTQVPGPDNHLGFGGTCFVKDIWSLKKIYEKHNVKSLIIDSVIERK